MKKGDKYVCDSCGLALVVCDECGCTDCGPVCCDKPMTLKKAKAAKKSKKR